MYFCLRFLSKDKTKQKDISMNYEEMLDSREGVAMNREQLPWGVFYKKLIDRKYRNVVELRSDLSDSILFCDALKNDEQFTMKLRSKNQLHFATQSDSNGVYEIEIESGNYQTFKQLVDNNPAVVAGQDYVDEVIKLLANVLAELHKNDVFQLCLAPQTVFARKGDNLPMLLCHGSFFKDKTEIYKGFEDYVAPEALAGEAVDERSDVYALGKFMEWFLSGSGMSFEYKKTLARATNPDPAQRYQSIDALLRTISRKRTFFRTVLSFCAALLISLICVWIYFEMVPDTVNVEFVTPADTYAEDPFDASLTDAELAGGSTDTTTMTDEERSELAAMQAKTEQIFRKQFTREAEKALSKIYSKERMNSSEQEFIASSNTIMDDLMQKRDELISQSGITTDKGNHIASEIISSIREQKKKQLKSFAVQGAQEGD